MQEIAQFFWVYYMLYGQQALGIGEAFSVMVLAVGADTVTLDANHPLAGQTLTFDIELVSLA